MARHHVGAAPAKWSNYYQHSFAQTFLKTEVAGLYSSTKRFFRKKQKFHFPLHKTKS